MAKGRAEKSYFKIWLKTAFEQSIGPIDLYSGLGAAAVTAVAHFLPTWEGELNNLLWQIPLWAAAGVVGVRLAFSPYWIWRNQAERIEALESRLKSIEDEYAYAFTLDNISMEDYRRKDDATGDIIGRQNQFVLFLRNTLKRPINYQVTKLIVDGRSCTNFQNRGGIVAADTTTNFHSPMCDAQLSNMDKPERFEIEIEIEYGAPDNSVVRLLKRSMSLDSYPGTPMGRTKLIYRSQSDDLLRSAGNVAG